MSIPFRSCDTRHYDTRSVEDGYREWAELYDRRDLDRMDLDLLHRVVFDGSRVRAAVDLGCGTGRIGAWLRDRGVAEVDGIDLTPEMLERARARGVYRCLEIGDMTATPFNAGVFDLVVSSLAVEHLVSLQPLYAEAERLAMSDGALAVVGYHPHFLLNGIPTHFAGRDGHNIAIDNTIHLMSDHVAAAARAGWRLVQLEERLVDATWVECAPSYQRHLGKPISFLAWWRRR